MKLLVVCLVLMGALLLPVRAGMSGAQEKEILDEHNAKRDEVGHSEPHLTWNANLAKVAQAYSAKCIWGHNKKRQDEAKNEGYSKYVGENLYMTTGKITMKKVVDAWFSEVKNYHIKTLSCDPGKMCGHYTQVVWKATTEVGCGLTSCAKLGTLSHAQYVVCNYGPGGNYRGQAPFETAKQSRLQVLLQMLMDEEEEERAEIEMVGEAAEFSEASENLEEISKKRFFAKLESLLDLKTDEGCPFHCSSDADCGSCGKDCVAGRCQ